MAGIPNTVLRIGIEEQLPAQWIDMYQSDVTWGLLRWLRRRGLLVRHAIIAIAKGDVGCMPWFSTVWRHH